MKSIFKNPFKSLEAHEWLLYIISLVVVGASNVLVDEIQPTTFIGTLIGVTALIFLARGDVWGQILTVLFSVLYSITSFQFRYFGEIITYLGMTAPIAFLSIITWLKHPYKEGKNEVKIHKLTAWQRIVMVLLTILVTTSFYFILKAFHTANLAVSTVSVATSFLASYLMLQRNSYYALAYAANDVVLMVLWMLASFENKAYFPMIMCFLMFFINDLYGFVNWKLRESKQGIVSF